MRGSLRLLACVLLGGCRSILGIEDVSIVDAYAPVDALPDAMVDARPCAGIAPYEICLEGIPLSPLNISASMTIDTNVGCTYVHVTPTDAWCVIAATTMSIGAGLQLVGTRPAVLLAMSRLDITASGTVDVSSRSNGLQGAGATTSGCDPSEPGVQDPNGASGGAGGSLGTRGGAGGPGRGGIVNGGTPGMVIAATERLRGGCPGGKGGLGATSLAAIGGDGGGAVYVLAGSELKIDGQINASGAGGQGGRTSRGGGGGAGSGGMILLSAPVLTISSTARIFANGGGGGGGAADTINGSSGGESAGPSSAAPGGPGAGSPGRGGDGSLAAGLGNGGLSGPGGTSGGGGGGGAGIIRVLSGQQFASTNISPPLGP